MPVRPAAGGGRWVSVDPGRLPRWLDGFAQRHGPYESVTLRLVAADGAIAELHPPPGVPDPADLASFIAAVTAPRRIGLLLARQASVAIGVALGDELTSSKVDSSYVQSRTAAGGWSQQRFARRRANQAKAAAGSAADLAVRLLLPSLGSLDAFVAGGDRRAVDAVLADPRLAPLAAILAERFLDVPEPRQATLVQALALARAVHIRLLDPA
jgi:Actinobacteria/chloroflexi VLRF1 release factor